jgi:hypothetical protein
MRSKVQMMINAWPSQVNDTRTLHAFNVTLINNNGVHKTPQNAPVVDPHSAVTVLIQVNPKEGVANYLTLNQHQGSRSWLRQPRLRRRIVRAEEPHEVNADSAVRVSIPPGGVVVVSVVTASA